MEARFHLVFVAAVVEIRGVDSEAWRRAIKDGITPELSARGDCIAVGSNDLSDSLFS